MISKNLRNSLVCVFLLIFLTGCVSFTLPTRDKPEGPVGKGTAFTGIIGGKGVQVGFVPNNPPLNKIDGPFGVAIKFFNYNQERVTVDSFTVGSTGVYDGFTNLADESITVEGAVIRETEQGPQFIAPGTEFTYVGQASRARDGSLHYGDFEFTNIDAGAGTSFYVDMLINDYLSKSYFQFCAFDLEATSLVDALAVGVCPTTQTISGPQLGFSYRYDPVVVSNIVRTLSSTRNAVRVTLDVTIEDHSEKQARITSGNAFERGQIVPADGMQQFFFELEPTSGSDLSFTCTSNQERLATSRPGSFLTLVLREGKAQVRCTGYDSLFEERKDYQYQITLRYPYEQTVSTSYIPIRADLQQPFS